MPEVNKVTYNGEVLIDLTKDTITPETLKAGVTAHAADGTSITGTAVLTVTGETLVIPTGFVTVGEGNGS